MTVGCSYHTKMTYGYSYETQCINNLDVIQGTQIMGLSALPHMSH